MQHLTCTLSYIVTKLVHCKILEVNKESSKGNRKKTWNKFLCERTAVFDISIFYAKFDIVKK